MPDSSDRAISALKSYPLPRQATPSSLPSAPCLGPSVLFRLGAQENKRCRERAVGVMQLRSAGMDLKRQDEGSHLGRTRQHQLVRCIYSRYRRPVRIQPQKWGPLGTPAADA